MSSVDFLTVGHGPGLVVIPGSTRRAHHYRAIAEALSDAYTVHVVERRGRGASPPQGPGYGLEQEVTDAIEVLDETGSAQIFGHSFGGLVALHVGLRRELDRLIAYEPGVSIAGSFPSGWMARFEPTRLLGGGRSPACLQEVLPVLAATIPYAKLVMTPEMDRNAPDLAAPAEVARLIRA